MLWILQLYWSDCGNSPAHCSFTKKLTGLLLQSSILSFPFTLSTVSPFSLLCLDDPEYRRNLANNTGRAKLIMGIRNFNLWRSQVRTREKIDLNQSWIYTHPFPLPLTQFVLFAPLKLSSHKNYSEVDKILEGIPCPPTVMPMVLKTKTAAPPKRDIRIPIQTATHSRRVKSYEYHSRILP